jgi:transcriptional regulator with XRE-family HTH domain
MAIVDLRELVQARKTLPEPSLRRAIRESAGVSLRQVAAYVGVTSSAVHFWEHGREPSPEHLPRYVEALQILRCPP